MLETENTKIVSIMNQEQERILLYAQKKFMADGFYKISMDEIAADLGVSKKTLYKHFESKDFLVEQAMFLFFESVHRQVLQLHQSSEPILEKFCALVQIIVSRIPLISKKFLQDMRIHAPALWEKVNAFRTEKIRHYFGILLSQGREEGYIKDYPEELVIQILVSLISGVINPEFLVTSRLTNQDAFRMTVTIFMNGILTDKGKKVFSKLRIGEIV